MNDNSKPVKISSVNLLFCGFTSGVLQAGVFNFWDRALYLSIKEHRNFLDLRNFEKPFSGVLQSLIQRAISGGLYFPLEDIFRGVLKEHVNLGGHTESFLAGTLAGGTNGIIMNPACIIKYHMWGAPEGCTKSFLQTGMEMYKKEGTRLFLVGSGSTLARDLTFGGIYGLLRKNSHWFRGHPDSEHRYWMNQFFNDHYQSYIANMLSAGIATIASSPINYVRTIQYAHSQDILKKSPIRTVPILRALMKECRTHQTLGLQVRFLGRQMRLGWGTARVGCGMAFAEQVYSFCSNQLK